MLHLEQGCRYRLPELCESFMIAISNAERTCCIFSKEETKMQFSHAIDDGRNHNESDGDDTQPQHEILIQTKLKQESLCLGRPFDP